MQTNQIARSTWIILGVTLAILAVLTGVFVTNSLRSENASTSGPQLLAGRKYEPDRSSPTKPVLACDLLPAGEVETILGRPVGSPVQATADNPLGESICLFPDPENPERTLVQVGIVFAQGMASFLQENGYTVEQLFDGRNLGGGQTQPVKDVGDKAFWGGAGTEIWNGLHVLVWDVYLDIDVFGGDSGADLEQAKAIAGSMLAELYPPR
ncbi:MAG: hypothetical protein ACK2T2_09405 [Anaerolineales bacterium]